MGTTGKLLTSPVAHARPNSGAGSVMSTEALGDWAEARSRSASGHPAHVADERAGTALSDLNGGFTEESLADA